MISSDNPFVIAAVLLTLLFACLHCLPISKNKKVSTLQTERIDSMAAELINLEARLTKILDGVESTFGNERLDFIFEAPASLPEVLAIEEALNYSIPQELRNFYLNNSSKVRMAWIVPEDYLLPETMIELSGGGDIEMGLEWLVNLHQHYNDTVAKYYSKKDNAYDRSLHNKFVFHKCWSGDHYAIDLEEENFGKVIYLSFNEAAGHGYILGNTFNEFMDNWVELACAGPDGNTLMMFLDNKTDGLNTTGENALWLKELLKL